MALECHQDWRGGSAVPGNTMNLVLSIALYASLCRALNLPLRFPGSPQTWHSIVDFTGCRIVGRSDTVGSHLPRGAESGFQRQ